MADFLLVAIICLNVWLAIDCERVHAENRKLEDLIEKLEREING